MSQQIRSAGPAMSEEEGVKLRTLIDSTPARFLSKQSFSTRNVVWKHTQDYIALAESLELDPSLWLLPQNETESITNNPKLSYRLLPVMTALKWKVHTLKALMLFADKGCRADLDCYFYSADQITMQFSLNINDWVRDVLTNTHGLEVRKALLKAHVKAMSSGLVESEDTQKFLQDSLNYFDTLMKCTSPIAAIAGDADKLACDSATVMGSAKEALLILAKKEGLEKDLMKLYEKAEGLLFLKKQKDQVVKPEKMKAELTAAQKEDIQRLMKVCANSLKTDDSIEAAFESAAWLKEKPFAACLLQRNHRSILTTALYQGNLYALKKLEEMGANIWLAAAQEKTLNPYEVIIDTVIWNRNAEKPELIQQMARLVLLGAWLNGGKDPKVECIKSLRDNFERMKGPGGRLVNANSQKPNAERLLCALEALSLEELISDHTKVNPKVLVEVEGVEVEQTPTTVRRRSL